MPGRDITKILFRSVYPLYIKKAQRKNRTKEEVDTLICWLTGYTPGQLEKLTAADVDFQAFFEQAPKLHPNRFQIKGLVCGVRVEDIEDPITQNTRFLDKLIDELAKGKPMDRILRQ